LKKKYQLIRHIKEFDRLKDENHTFRQIVFESFERRKNLLKSIEFKDLQTTLNEIHVEYIKCYKIIIDSQSYLRHYDNEIQKTINEYHDELWDLQDKIRASSFPYNSQNNSRPDLNALLNVNDDKNEFSILESFQSSGARGSIHSCFGEDNNTKILIEENDHINGAFESLLTDLNELLKQI